MILIGSKSDQHPKQGYYDFTCKSCLKLGKQISAKALYTPAEDKYELFYVPDHSEHVCQSKLEKKRWKFNKMGIKPIWLQGEGQFNPLPLKAGQGNASGYIPATRTIFMTNLKDKTKH